MRTGVDETFAPKYAYIERERRWLVDGKARPLLDGLPSVLIEDRYLIGTRMRLRRMTDSMSDAVSLKLTKKYEADDPLARPIVTSYLTEDEFSLLATLPSRQLANDALSSRAAANPSTSTSSLARYRDWSWPKLNGPTMLDCGPCARPIGRYEKSAMIRATKAPNSRNSAFRRNTHGPHSDR